MQSSKESARIHAARILSIVIQNSDEMEFMEIVKEMLADMKNKVWYSSKYYIKTRSLVHNIFIGVLLLFSSITNVGFPGGLFVFSW